MLKVRRQRNGAIRTLTSALGTKTRLILLGHSQIGAVYTPMRVVQTLAPPQNLAPENYAQIKGGFQSTLGEK